MHLDNKRKFEYCRIPAWWSKGYTGKGVKVAVFERTDKGHGYNVADILRQIAPDAEILSRPRPLIEIEGGDLTPDSAGRMAAFYRGLVAEDVNIVVMSLSGTGTTDIEALERDILHVGGVTLVTSAGNDGDDIEPWKSAYLDTWIAVGAADLVNDKPKRLPYSETGPKLDALAWGSLRTTIGGYFEGTSCAAPFAAGMLALWSQYYFEKTGRYPTFDESYDFARANAEDLDDEGFDERTGYGLFRLPAELPDLRPPAPEPPAPPPEPEPQPKPKPPEQPAEVSGMINDIQVSPNFRLSEFQSKDTGEVMLHPLLLSRLQALRTRLGRAVTVNSGYRTAQHNGAVGGAPNSQHRLGRAADIKVAGINVWDLARQALAGGFSGVGVYPYKGFVHVDVRAGRSLWWENKAGQQLAWDGTSVMT